MMAARLRGLMLVRRSDDLSSSSSYDHFFPKFAMSGSALVDFVRTHDGLFCSCFFLSGRQRFFFFFDTTFLMSILFLLRFSSS